jgi:hypothetical protein
MINDFYLRFNIMYKKMNKQILENRLIDSVALVINYAGNQRANWSNFPGTSPALKSENQKSLTFTRAFANWHNNQNYLPQTGHKME